MNIFVETKRLYLRRIIKEDNIAFYDIMGNEQTMKYLGKTLTHEEIDGYINSVANSDYSDIYGEYAIVLKEDEKVIGQLGINCKKRDSKVDISYMLNSSYWHKGYAFECVKEVVTKLITEEKIHKIVADCDAENTSSMKIMQKLGMKQEGLLRQERYSKNFDKYYDVAVYGLLSDELKID